VGRHVDPEGGWARLLSTPACWGLADRGLVLGQTYAFRCRARNRLGWSTFSPSSRKVTVFKVLPPPPPVVDEAGVSYLRLRWRPPPSVPASEIDSYELELLDVPEAEAAPKDKPPPWKALTAVGGPRSVEGAGREEPTFILQGLLPGHRYQLRVKALAFEGWTDWSEASGIITTERRY